jgi:small subunit ribosomal protein S15
MSFGLREKAAIVEKFQRRPEDTGSSEVQVALLTGRIVQLTEHLKIHKKDFHCRRGLIALVNKRRKLLVYLKKNQPAVHTRVIQDLGIRG